MLVYNSLSRSKERVVPLEENHVRIYTCGPTVYNFAHIGNFRAYIFEDILRRALKFDGFKVTQVMNLTDVDDKTIRGSMEAGISLQEFTAPFIQAFFNDIKTLNIEPAEYYPAATDHIPEMIAIIEKLLEKGLAYTSADGSVYFSVAKFPEYGKLAHLDRENLKVGSRVAQDEYDKESYGDFALWKGWDESDGDVVWDAPWGRGRPGWHIECSAMAMKILGESFEMHTGGIDNLFPHHENEIAQTEGATGKPFVRYWLHCAHLRVNGEKMSKSLGNFYTLRDLAEMGWGGREIRYVLINGHYRQPLNFTFAALEAARTTLARIDQCIDSLQEFGGNNTAVALPEWAKQHVDDFKSAINDDLNIPEALAALFAVVRESNSATQNKSIIPEQAVALLELMQRFDQVLGVVFFDRKEEAEAPAEIKELLEQRAAARSAKEWAESDRLRDLMAELGWQVRDSKEGQRVKHIAG